MCSTVYRRSIKYLLDPIHGQGLAATLIVGVLNADKPGGGEVLVVRTEIGFESLQGECSVG